MPDPAKITEEEAYKQFTAALRRGQEGLDELDPEVKKLAMGPAEASLGRPSWSDPTDPSSEGFDIVEEVAPDYGYKPIENLPPIVKQEFDALPEAVPRKDPSAEGYEPIEAVAPPDPNAGKAYRKREKYKTFRMPKGMSDEQIEAWKGGVDDRLLESDERLQERIESAHPADQAQDLLRRASEGDLEAIKDIGYLGLNIAAMSPIGQIPQMGADVGVGAMDLAEGDYTGAAISGAAVVLPVTAGMLKAAIKNPAAAKIVSKLDDVDPHTAGAPGDPDAYIKHLVERGAAEDIAKLSDDELIDAYKGLSEANIVIRRGVKESDLVGDLATTKDLDVPPYTRGGSVDAADTTEEAFARTYATKELLKNELQDRALDNPAIAKQFAQRMAKVDKGTVLERKKHLKSYNDEMKELTKAAPPLVSAGMVKQIMKRDYGDEARDILINHGQIGYEIEQALLKSRGKVTDAIKELQEYRSSLGDNLMKAIQDTEKIAPMDMGKLDSDLMHSADYSLDEIIEAAKQGKTLPALGPAFGKEGAVAKSIRDTEKLGDIDELEDLLRGMDRGKVTMTPTGFIDDSGTEYVGRRVLPGEIKFNFNNKTIDLEDGTVFKIDNTIPPKGNFKPTIVNKDPVRSPDYNPNKLGDDEWGY